MITSFTDSSPKIFNPSFLTFHNDTDFTDLTLIVSPQKHQINVHRVIVCANSGFFKYACHPTKTTIVPSDKPHHLLVVVDKIYLPDVHLDTIKYVLEFLYTGDYSDSVTINDNVDGDKCEIARLKTHADIFAAADVFDVPLLKQLVMAKISRACDEIISKTYKGVWSPVDVAAMLVTMVAHCHGDVHCLADFVSFILYNVEEFWRDEGFVQTVRESKEGVELLKMVYRGVCCEQ